MERSHFLAIILIVTAAAHAQTDVQVNGQPGTSGSGIASDPLAVPTSTLPTQGSTSPQGGLQLSGEAANTATQASNTRNSGTGGAGVAGVPSSALCTAVIPSTTGMSSPSSLFGAGSGC
jgi:hypothetical protein